MARRVLCLFAFLTRLPAHCHSLEEAARGYPLVPLVGLVEGLLVALAVTLSGSAMTGAGLGLVAHLAITGGLHLDGFADYSDAMGAGASGEKALSIMKDPRRGGFALSYTAALLIAKYGGLAGLQGAPLAIIASYTVAAEAMYLASSMLPEPRHRGLGQLFYKLGASREARVLNAFVSTALFALLVLLDPWRGAAALGGGVAAALLAIRDAGRRIGYASGDVLGFVYEASGTAGLLAAAIVANPPRWL